MNKKTRRIKQITRWLAIMMVCFLLFPAGSLAEDQVNSDEQTMETVTPDKMGTPPNEESEQGNQTPAEIETLEQVPEVNINQNTDQQIVVVYADSGEDNVKNLALTTDEVVSGEQVSNRVDLIEVSVETNVEALMADLAQNPNVLAVDNNAKIEVTALPNDPYVVNGSAWQFQRIGADQTWDQVSNGDPVVVAVIDTGLNVNHPDFVGNTVAGYDFVTGKTNVVDLAGHGTAVSGCIAAVTNNGVGTAGIAGLANIKIAPYRTGGMYSGDTQLDVAYICAAILKAAERPEVKVINMSFGGYGTFSSLAVAVNEAVSAGKVVVASSGNEGESWNARVGQYSYPASYDHVISVGAINKDNTRSSFSQYNDRVDLSAPGQSVLTTAKSGGYEYASGTSFSSPIVAGACAVLMAADAGLDAGAVETILKSTALDLGTAGSDAYYGSGLIQLNQAVASINSSETIGTTYRTHVQNVGWQIWKYDGQSSGTSGQSLRLEGIEIKMNNLGTDLGVEYQTHVQNIGWQGFKSNGQTSGTYGQSLRLEAIQIRLTGAAATNYDVYYRVHSQNYGWLDWAQNGGSSGTQGKSLRLEAIEIRVVPKGAAAPGSTNRPFIL
ncbi:S8 family serine peptidase [Acetobacterium malicum]|uniref:S8 family serine peptidase n=1 Tax=Acetobacterium malicum TaxID=52692 RepID=A0ABR6Z1A5_9FIRM|nr:S8 family serine peptidase [Acetobacterium malicum]MBC3901056.1 S8 family serine peptidase [Acetobacterium malicum]